MTPSNLSTSTFRVVSIATNLPGPITAEHLRTYGAHVTKVEPPSGDLMAQFCDPYYEELAAGQDVVRLDLKEPAGQESLHQLLAEADVFITSHRPAALERLGLDWNAIHAQHPQLNYVAIVGHSMEEADADQAGHDLTYQAHAGTLDPPNMPTIPVADVGGAERATAAALAALYHRERTGEATFQEVSLSHAAQIFGAPARHGLTQKGGLLGGGLHMYRIYPAKEGWVAVALIEPHFQASFCELLNIENDEQAYEEILKTKTAAEWQDWAVKHNLPVAAVT